MALNFTELSILHHVAIVFAILWFLTSYGYCNLAAYFVAFVYLCLVYERHVLRLQRRLHYLECINSNRRKLLSDSESVRWLNHAVEKVWPVCMEQIASQKFLLPIIPWFLEKYKPWTAKKAVVQHLYLGKNPPMFTEIRVLPQSADDDHLVLELGMNFLTGDDMSAILAVKLRRRLGFGLWAKMHVKGMHIEGKVLVGVKFLHQWPFLERLRLSFVEPPYFQMTVKPIFNHGVDVTELPGIAGWLDKLLSVAFQQTLVEPNLLVVDVKKFVSDPKENWFTVDEKHPIAYAKVEIIEGADMKPSDMNGLADPYVKGRLGPYKFRTKIQWKTLAPKWFEEFRIPITSWETPNVLFLEVRDKDRIFDDTLGDCKVDFGEMRGGLRYSKWIPLQNIKMGRLHLAVTIIDGDKVDNGGVHGEMSPTEKETSTAGKDDYNSVSVDNSTLIGSKAGDEFEPIDIEGQENTGIWVHHPGNESSQTWESRKGKFRLAGSDLQCEIGSPGSIPGSRRSDSNSSEENNDGKKGNRLASIRRGFKKIGIVLQRSPKTDSTVELENNIVPTPRHNIRAVDEKNTRINFVGDEPKADVLPEDVGLTEAGTEGDNGKHHAATMAKGIFKHAGSLKKVLTRKASNKAKCRKETQKFADLSDSSDEEESPRKSSIIVEGIEMNPACTTQQAIATERNVPGAAPALTRTNSGKSKETIG